MSIRYTFKEKAIEIICSLCFLFFGLYAIGFDQEESYRLKREEMVNEQIIKRGIKDGRVIKAMLSVERHVFVPQEVKDFAYEDRPLPIGYNQTISQPYIVAFMTEAAFLKSSDKVLEIGTGSGYQAAILAEIVKEVYTIERIEPLAKEARKRLQNLGYKNITVKWDDGYKGLKEHAPFDAIIVTAAPEKILEELLKQLKVGGRMIIPIGSFSQELYAITKTKGGFDKKKLMPVAFVPMVRDKDK